MKAFTEYLKELSFYEDARRALMAQKTVLISGCADAQKAQMLCGQGEDYPYKLVLTFSDVKAKELYEDYSFFDKNTILFPCQGLHFLSGGYPRTGDDKGADLLLSPDSGKGAFDDRNDSGCAACALSATADVGGKLYHDLCGKHRRGRSGCDEARKDGLRKTYQVEEPGQFSIRGGIIDIYDLTEENPYRIELWGDEVESRSVGLMYSASVRWKR